MISLPLKNWWGQMHYALFETPLQNSTQEAVQTIATLPKTTQKENNANRLKINTDDLKLISTALIRYQKQLVNSNQKDKAARVALLDEMFYNIIQQDSLKIE